jgi:hypothetical protein
MIRRCAWTSCTFATADPLWFESHQIRHLVIDAESQPVEPSGQPSTQNGQMGARDYDVSRMTAEELRRAKRHLEASLALAGSHSMTSAPTMTMIRAIDTELARKGTDG